MEFEKKSALSENESDQIPSLQFFQIDNDFNAQKSEQVLEQFENIDAKYETIPNIDLQFIEQQQQKNEQKPTEYIENNQNNAQKIQEVNNDDNGLQIITDSKNIKKEEQTKSPLSAKNKQQKAELITNRTNSDKQRSDQSLRSQKSTSYPVQYNDKNIDLTTDLNQTNLSKSPIKNQNKNFPQFSNQNDTLKQSIESQTQSQKIQNFLDNKEDSQSLELQNQNKTKTQNITTEKLINESNYFPEMRPFSYHDCMSHQKANKVYEHQIREEFIFSNQWRHKDLRIISDGHEIKLVKEDEDEEIIKKEKKEILKADNLYKSIDNSNNPEQIIQQNQQESFKKLNSKSNQNFLKLGVMNVEIEIGRSYDFTFVIKKLQKSQEQEKSKMVIGLCSRQMFIKKRVDKKNTQNNIKKQLPYEIDPNEDSQFDGFFISNDAKTYFLPDQDDHHHHLKDITQLHHYHKRKHHGDQQNCIDYQNKDKNYLEKLRKENQNPFTFQEGDTITIQLRPSEKSPNTYTITYIKTKNKDIEQQIQQRKKLEKRRKSQRGGTLIFNKLPPTNKVLSDEEIQRRIGEQTQEEEVFEQYVHLDYDEQLYPCIMLTNVGDQIQYYKEKVNLNKVLDKKGEVLVKFGYFPWFQEWKQFNANFIKKDGRSTYYLILTNGQKVVPYQTQKQRSNSNTQNSVNFQQSDSRFNLQTIPQEQIGTQQNSLESNKAYNTLQKQNKKEKILLKINLDKIIEVNYHEDQNIFQLVDHKNYYNFEVKNEEEASDWVERIKTLRNESICKCCDKPINGKRIGLLSNIRELYHLGAAVPLYFHFLKYQILFLLLIFIFSGIISTIYNTTGNNCDKIKCQDNSYYTFLSSINRDENPELVGILNLVAGISLMGFIIFYRKRINQKINDIDDKILSVSDYSLMINKVPKNQNYNTLLRYFQNCLKSHNNNKYFSDSLKHPLIEILEVSVKNPLKFVNENNNNQQLSDSKQQQQLITTEQDEIQGEQDLIDNFFQDDSLSITGPQLVENNKQLVQCMEPVLKDNKNIHTYNFDIIKISNPENIAFGVCFRKLAQLEDYEFKRQSSNIKHGFYIIFGDGKLYSDHEEQKNNIQTDFTIHQYDSIQLEINFRKKIITFRNLTQKQEQKIQFKLNNQDKRDYLNLCCIVTKKNDEIQFLSDESFKKSDLSNEKMYETDYSSSVQKCPELLDLLEKNGTRIEVEKINLAVSIDWFKNKQQQLEKMYIEENKKEKQEQKNKIKEEKNNKSQIQVQVQKQQQKQFQEQYNQNQDYKDQESNQSQNLQRKNVRTNTKILEIQKNIKDQKLQDKLIKEEVHKQELQKHITDISQFLQNHQNNCQDFYPKCMPKNELKQIFHKFDESQDGKIGIKEIKQVADTIGLKDLNQEDLKLVLKNLDKDGDDQVSFLEFFNWWRDFESKLNKKEEQKRKLQKERKDQKNRQYYLEQIKSIFEAQDKDNDNTVSIKELKGSILSEVLSERVTKDQLNEIFDEMDKDDNDRITFKEFSDWWELQEEAYRIKQQEGVANKNWKVTRQHNNTIFVSFEHEYQKDMVYLMHKHSNKKFSYIDKNGKKQSVKLKVRQAPEPDDVIWENLCIASMLKLKRRTGSQIITAIMLVTCFFLQTVIAYVKEELLEMPIIQSNFLFIGLTSAIPALATLGINAILTDVIIELSIKERYSQTTNFQISIARKSAFAQFLNTIVVVFLSKYLSDDKDFAKNDGLIASVWIFMITNIFVPPLLKIVNPGYIIFKLRKQLYYKKNRHDELILEELNQQKANELFEKDEYDTTQELVVAVNTLLLAAFYAYLLPLGSILCIFAIILQIISSRYALLRDRKVPIALGSQLVYDILDNFIEFVVIIFALGCFIFEYLLFEESSYYNMALLGTAIIYFLLPNNRIWNSVIEDDRKQFKGQDSYRDSYQKFTDDYDRRNPLTKTQARKQYLQFQIRNLHDPKHKDALMDILNVKKQQEYDIGEVDEKINKNQDNFKNYARYLNKFQRLNLLNENLQKNIKKFQGVKKIQSAISVFKSTKSPFSKIGSMQANSPINNNYKNIESAKSGFHTKNGSISPLQQQNI